jgi:hypothetical protein
MEPREEVVKKLLVQGYTGSLGFNRKRGTSENLS